MKLPLVLIPFRDSLTTLQRTILALKKPAPEIPLLLCDDASSAQCLKELNTWLETQNWSKVDVLSLPVGEDAPQYGLALRAGLQRAHNEMRQLLVVESDVEVLPGVVLGLQRVLQRKPDAVMAGAVTIDPEGVWNFPYAGTFRAAKLRSSPLIRRRSLSFCCTLLDHGFVDHLLHTPFPDTGWMDLKISAMARKLGTLWLALDLQVVHHPHSSRPWKLLKYKNPLLYYFYKITRRFPDA